MEFHVNLQIETPAKDGSRGQRTSAIGSDCENGSYAEESLVMNFLWDDIASAHTRHGQMLMLCIPQIVLMSYCCELQFSPRERNEIKSQAICSIGPGCKHSRITKHSGTYARILWQCRKKIIKKMR